MITAIVHGISIFFLMLFVHTNVATVPHHISPKQTPTPIITSPPATVIPSPTIDAAKQSLLTQKQAYDNYQQCLKDNLPSPIPNNCATQCPPASQSGGNEQDYIQALQAARCMLNCAKNNTAQTSSASDTVRHSCYNKFYAPDSNYPLPQDVAIPKGI